MALLFSSTAISPVEETDINCVRLKPMDRDSGASGRAVKTSTDCPAKLRCKGWFVHRAQSEPNEWCRVEK